MNTKEVMIARLFTDLIRKGNSIGKAQTIILFKHNVTITDELAKVLANDALTVNEEML